MQWQVFFILFTRLFCLAFGVTSENTKKILIQVIFSIIYQLTDRQ